jgi:hypothetical protein
MQWIVRKKILKAQWNIFRRRALVYGLSWRQHQIWQFDLANALIEIDNLTPIQPRVDVADRPAFRAFEVRGNIVPVPIRQIG